MNECSQLPAMRECWQGHKTILIKIRQRWSKEWISAPDSPQLHGVNVGFDKHLGPQVQVGENLPVGLV